jgi:glycerophosphoryl diester phosphodiesterase
VRTCGEAFRKISLLKVSAIGNGLVEVNTGKANWPALDLLASDRPLVIGHRGYCAHAPENTLPSFQLALAAGADLVELDYHHSRDGTPVVVHDDTLDRTTDARKAWRQKRVKVGDRTAAEIQSLDAGSWFEAEFAGARVPLLTEALDLICGSGGVALIEHKSGDADTLVKILRAGCKRRGETPGEPSQLSRLDAAGGSRGRSPQPEIGTDYLNKVAVISFDWRFLRDFHELESSQVLGALGPPEQLADGRKPSRLSGRLDGQWLDALAETGARLAVWSRQVSVSTVQLAHQRGLKVWVYTVNDTGTARGLLQSGVDGIITNQVRLIRKVAGAGGSR